VLAQNCGSSLTILLYFAVMMTTVASFFANAADESTRVVFCQNQQAFNRFLDNALQ
jgi:hypothetical protein